MKERVKVAISKEAYEKIQFVDFSDVVVSLKALRCELSLDGKTERDHCAMLDIELEQEENQMNIDKLETQSEESMKPRAKNHKVHLRDYQKKTFPANSEGFSEWSGKGLPPVGVECEWIGGGLNHGDWGLVIVHAYHNDFAWIEKLRDNSIHTVGNPANFRKPETPEAKEKRERLEAAFDLYLIDFEKSGHENFNFNQFCKYDYMRNFWLAIVDKTGYRKVVK